jgi:small subunit ribosomal protein S5
MPRPSRKPVRREKPEFEQKLLNLARVTRVVKGGRRFRFRATVVIGNRKGKVGVGVSKGQDVSDSIKKAYNDAKKNLVEIPLSGATIPHDVKSKLGSARVLLKPGHPGQGVIAGGAVRAVVDLLGVKDIVSKSLGSSNPLNVARATVKALQELRPALVSPSEPAPETGRQEAEEAKK